MPRDPRPWVAYPLNYTGHPRIESLSDAAFRVFHEMNDYCRVHGLDGLIPVVTAKKRWKAKVLTELVTGIDDRPLVQLTEGGYFLRSYEEHQFTTEDAERLRERRAEAGRLGGIAKANARDSAGKPLASATAKGWQNVAESESESESELHDLTDVDHPPASSPDLNVRAEGLDHQLATVIEERNATAVARANALGINDPTAIWDRLERTLPGKITLPDAIRIAAVILDRAKTYVRNPEGYIATACKDTPDEVRTIADQIDVQIGAAA